MAFDGTLAGLRPDPVARRPAISGWFAVGIATLMGLSLFGFAFPNSARTLLEWFPLLATGFGVNVALTLIAVSAASLAGTLIGLAELSPRRWLRWPAALYVTVFRNAPYLVVVFAASYTIPFEFRVLGTTIPFPDWLKVAIGLALPAGGHIAELVRGAVQSIPATQWEAAAAIGFSRWQTLAWIILPQSFRRILPPWTNLCASVAMNSALAALVGVQDLLHTANDASTAVRRTEFTIAIYLLILLWFFLFCYPLSRTTRYLERRFSQG
ncbi:amino acid ABC transporter permease [Bradyrhizobium sp. SSUT18]|uniref:amino acid ABC transporter permease n=1 Tax=Bradyrhizobium sp. SSUT18 TaxID=3040602 RepID=UPI002446FC24|nr:amino acid ABC transporter permease [Bradyrhizobium sp. SSUT18]MDH2399915.1 amino acid ABC transporter permease [Bradyrhizobium sp. SSUT18]